MFACEDCSTLTPVLAVIFEISESKVMHVLKAKRKKNVKLLKSDRPEPRDFFACEANQEPFPALLST